ncbi:UDP-N-acetylenolpyruvoylglucosamine reductase [hydrothermal vent metagenome]|uniref:UDP-N-acetylmuramate dehydrogenase n=1 Tax=hydrothermal vent metagenome TaxID=652676 RepID=A0A3B0R8X3_9ZZZZ
MNTGLPSVRGKIETHAPLDKLTWFRVGGPADILFTPEDADDLAHFLQNIPADMPVMALGVGSNLLVRDGGIRGAVIRFGKKFAQISVDKDEIIAGAGAPDIAVAGAARDAELSGLEFLRGIPGTIGGAVRMNAGAYGAEMADILISAQVMNRYGQCHEVTKKDLHFSYRHSELGQDMICLSVRLKGTFGNRDEIARRMQDIADAREDSQPLRTPTGGSTFKNPDGVKAWSLIDGAGCRGLQIGGARVSEKHCNFLINAGNATAQDIEDLGEEIRRRVMNNSGVDLTWEIRIVGEKEASS